MEGGIGAAGWNCNDSVWFFRRGDSINKCSPSRSRRAFSTFRCAEIAAGVRVFNSCPIWTELQPSSLFFTNISSSSFVHILLLLDEELLFCSSSSLLSSSLVISSDNRSVQFTRSNNSVAILSTWAGSWDIRWLISLPATWRKQFHFVPEKLCSICSPSAPLEEIHFPPYPTKAVVHKLNALPLEIRFRSKYSHTFLTNSRFTTNVYDLRSWGGSLGSQLWKSYVEIWLSGMGTSDWTAAVWQCFGVWVAPTRSVVTRAAMVVRLKYPPWTLLNIGHPAIIALFEITPSRLPFVCKFCRTTQAKKPARNEWNPSWVVGNPAFSSLYLRCRVIQSSVICHTFRVYFPNFRSAASLLQYSGRLHPTDSTNTLFIQ